MIDTDAQELVLTLKVPLARVWRIAAFTAVGATLAYAVWADPGNPIALPLLCVFIAVAVLAVLLRPRNEFVQTLRGEGDERQRLIARDAATCAAAGMVVSCAAGTIYEFVQNQNPDGYAVVLAVGVATFLVALGLLRRFR